MQDDTSDSKKPATKSPIHGRPSKAYLATLRKATEEDYKLIERACVQAILTGQKSIVLTTNYVTEIPDDFPFLRKITREGPLKHCRINARAMLKWLNDRGYSDVTTQKLRFAMMKFTKNSLDDFLNLGEEHDVFASVS